MMRRLLIAVVAASRLVSIAAAQTPADTYFSLAVTDNSHNHSGHCNLFLDFQQSPFSAGDETFGVVASVEVSPGAITLDGDAAEWDPSLLTTVHGLPLSNYSLSDALDAVPVQISVGSAWDATHVYFVVRWEDAGHDASTRYRKWIFGDQGGGETGWNELVHKGATAGAPNASAVNASGHELLSGEAEDFCLLMFPIVDAEGAYTNGGLGCGMYCHPDLMESSPWSNYTGGSCNMRTNVVGDKADTWKWRASVTNPTGNADDRFIRTGVIPGGNGRLSDAGGISSYTGNEPSGNDPEYMHQSGLGYGGDALFDWEKAPFGGSPSPGTEMPHFINRVASGNRGDIDAVGTFDSVSKEWTVEFRRVRDTGSGQDHAFTGTDASPPTIPVVTTADAVAGRALYDANCAGCHGGGGIGVVDPADVDLWQHPRIQRAAGPQISLELLTNPDMLALQALLSNQDREDIACYLQTQATYLATWTLDVTVVGSGGVTSKPSGIDSLAGASSQAYTDGAPMTLTAGDIPGTIVQWSGGPTPQWGPTCTFTLTADTSLTATYVPLDSDGPGTHTGPVGTAIVFFPSTQGLVAEGLSPGGRIVVLAGTRRGSGRLRRFPGARIGIANPVVLARLRASAEGRLTLPLRRWVRRFERHERVWLQLLDTATGRTSRLLRPPGR